MVWTLGTVVFARICGSGGVLQDRFFSPCLNLLRRAYAVRACLRAYFFSVRALFEWTARFCIVQANVCVAVVLGVLFCFWFRLSRREYAEAFPLLTSSPRHCAPSSINPPSPRPRLKPQRLLLANPTQSSLLRHS